MALVLPNPHQGIQMLILTATPHSNLNFDFKLDLILNFKWQPKEASNFKTHLENFKMALVLPNPHQEIQMLILTAIPHSNFKFDLKSDFNLNFMLQPNKGSNFKIHLENFKMALVLLNPHQGIQMLILTAIPLECPAL